jgi:hypothetical protein
MEPARTGEQLAHMGRADDESVPADKTSVRLSGEDDVCDTGKPHGVDKTGQDGEDDKQSEGAETCAHFCPFLNPPEDGAPEERADR